MSEHTFPGPQFPGPLPVRISLPESWRPVTLPGVAMAFIDGDSPEGVPTNIVVVVARVGGSPTLDEVAAAVREKLGGPRVTALSTDVPRVAGQPAIRTVLGVDAPAKSVTLVQAQTVLARDSSVQGQLDVVQVHLTCRADLWPAKRPVLDAALATMAVG